MKNKHDMTRDELIETVNVLESYYYEEKHQLMQLMDELFCCHAKIRDLELYLLNETHRAEGNSVLAREIEEELH